MAKLTGPFELKGSLGNVSFIKTKDGVIVRQKGGVSKKRIKTDPAFQRTRENISEFTHAVAAGTLFRRAFKPMIYNINGRGVSNRLTSVMMKVIQSDDVNRRGERSVDSGDVTMLDQFEFNEDARLLNALRADFTSVVDRETGNIIVDIRAFTPEKHLSAPKGATHLRFSLGSAVIDFENQESDVTISESDYLLTGQKELGPLQLVTKISPRSSGPRFLVLGIEFVQLVNGKYHSMEGHNSAMVVRVVRHEQ